MPSIAWELRFYFGLFRAIRHSVQRLVAFHRFSIGPFAKRTMAHLTQPSAERNAFCFSLALLAPGKMTSAKRTRTRTRPFTRPPYRQWHPSFRHSCDRGDGNVAPMFLDCQHQNGSSRFRQVAPEPCRVQRRRHAYH
jgi:hypothetical protein